MLSAIGLWLAKQGGGLLLGFISDVIVGLWKTHEANEAQRERGRLEAVAEAEREAAERAAQAKRTSEKIDGLDQAGLDGLADDLGNDAPGKG